MRQWALIDDIMCCTSNCKYSIDRCAGSYTDLYGGLSVNSIFFFFLGLCELNDVMSSSIQRQHTNIFACAIVFFFPLRLQILETMVLYQRLSLAWSVLQVSVTTLKFDPCSSPISTAAAVYCIVEFNQTIRALNNC